MIISFTSYKLFHSKDLLSHSCKVLVSFMVFSRCEAPVKEGKSISKNNTEHLNVSHDEIKNMPSTMDKETHCPSCEQKCQQRTPQDGSHIS